uniref:Uncharacterized protein n=1 Tax=Triticum urartu TaxID=4572 RepID=A0A8R7Q318_TRIUA
MAFFAGDGGRRMQEATAGRLIAAIGMRILLEPANGNAGLVERVTEMEELQPATKFAGTGHNFCYHRLLICWNQPTLFCCHLFC